MDLVPVLVAVWTAKFEKILKNRGIPRNQVTGNQKTRAVRLSPVLNLPGRSARGASGAPPGRSARGPRSMVHKLRESTSIRLDLVRASGVRLFNP